MEKGKYFLALVIPQPWQSEIMELKNYVKEHFNSKAALRSPAHITLHMPFEWRDDKEKRLLEALDTFTFPSAVHVQLKDFSHFESRVVFVDVVKNENLWNLQKQLVKHVKANLNLFNEADNPRGFHPHVTIAFRDLKKVDFRLAWDHFKEQHYNCKFTTHSFSLLKHSPGKWEVYKEFAFAK
jgi:2'-5' RNA ligase